MRDLTYYAFPDINPPEQIMKEFRWRTRMAGHSLTASHVSSWRPRRCGTSPAQIVC